MIERKNTSSSSEARAPTGVRRRPPVRRPPPASPARPGAKVRVEAEAPKTPLDRLQEATVDGALLRQEDLHAVLTSHALRAERQANTLAARGEGLLEMLFAPQPEGENKKGPKPADPSATLDLMTRLTRLYSSYASEARKTIELMDRLSRPHTPSVRVVASGEQVNIGAAQQVNNRDDV